MADDQALSRELTSLLEVLPRAHLVEISRGAAIGGLKAASRGHLEEMPLDSMLALLFADFSTDKISGVVREMGLSAVRNNAWNQLVSPPEDGQLQIRVSNPAAAQTLRTKTGPAILAFWHLGASQLMALGLQSIGVPALVITQKAPPAWVRDAVSPEMEMAITDGDPSRAVPAMKTAIDRLKKGGVVALGMDAGQGQRELTVPCLGRRIPLGRGAAVLARLTGAPIVPCVLTWGPKDWSLDFRLFDPMVLPPATAALNADAWDQEVLTVAARRFAEIIRAFPGQLRLETLARLAKGLPG